MPQTPLKGYEIPVTGSLSGTWGDLFNTNVLVYVDENLGASVSKSMTAGNVTLSTTEARKAYLIITGSVSTPRTLTSAANGVYFVQSVYTGSSTVTLTNGVAGVVIPKNRNMLVFADTTNGVRIIAINGDVTSGAYNPFPFGTQMLFYQGAVPTGWNLITTWDDYGLVLSSAAGGTTAGTLAWNSIFGTAGRTATDTFVLTTTEIPSHQHTFTLEVTGTGGTSNTTAHYYARQGVVTVGAVNTSGSTGGGEGHTHPIDLRVQQASIIVGARGSA